MYSPDHGWADYNQHTESPVGASGGECCIMDNPGPEGKKPPGSRDPNRSLVSAQPKLRDPSSPPRPAQSNLFPAGLGSLWERDRHRALNPLRAIQPAPPRPATTPAEYPNQRLPASRPGAIPREKPPAGQVGATHATPDRQPPVALSRLAVSGLAEFSGGGDRASGPGPPGLTRGICGQSTPN